VQRVEKPVRAAVAIVRDDDQLLRLQELRQQGDRSHARCSNRRTGATFEFGERPPEGIAGGITRARIVVLALLTVAAERERRGQVNRRHDSTVVRVAFEGGAHGPGGDRVFVGHSVRSSDCAKDIAQDGRFLQEGVVAIRVN
jgi:hypothetical protein